MTIQEAKLKTGDKVKITKLISHDAFKRDRLVGKIAVVKKEYRLVFLKFDQFHDHIFLLSSTLIKKL